MDPITQNLLATIGLILGAMAVVSALEAAIPLYALGRSGRAHLAPNLTLTLIAFATNAALNTGVVVMLVWLEARGWGLLNTHAVSSWLGTLAVVAALDFAFYVAHVTMHKLPGLWRFHRVHHSDPAVDVTTTIRQHPGESVIRYAFIAVTAAMLGASPAAFAVYRTASALNGLLEHANLRVPRWLDTALSWLTTWPNMHKIHHSRVAAQTDSNYGNLFSCWDRMFSTFTPAHQGVNVAYGLDGLDAPAQQTAIGLLAMPFTDESGGELGAATEA